MNPLAHYLQYGADQGRKPNPLFDTAYYLRQYPDVLESGLNPLAHYIEFGAYRGSKPEPSFLTPAYYRNIYVDVMEVGDESRWSIILSMVLSENRKPNPLFDIEYYLDQYR